MVWIVLLVGPVRTLCMTLRVTRAPLMAARAAARGAGFEPGTLLKNQSEIYPASEFPTTVGRARQFRIVRSEHVETFPDGPSGAAGGALSLAS
jgi:hypothetical protein